MTKAFSEAFQEQIATKHGLSEAVNELRHEMAILEQRLVIKMGGMFLTAIIVLSGIMKLIHG